MPYMTPLPCLVTRCPPLAIDSAIQFIASSRVFDLLIYSGLGHGQGKVVMVRRERDQGPEGWCGGDWIKFLGGT